MEVVRSFQYSNPNKVVVVICRVGQRLPGCAEVVSEAVMGQRDWNDRDHSWHLNGTSMAPQSGIILFHTLGPCIREGSPENRPIGYLSMCLSSVCLSIIYLKREKREIYFKDFGLHNYGNWHVQNLQGLQAD